MSEWSLQDAKNRFSAVVKAAIDGTPQRVTRRGKPAVVVIGASDYDRLVRLDRASAPSLPALLLAIPQDGGDFERVEIGLRDVDF